VEPSPRFRIQLLGQPKFTFDGAPHVFKAPPRTLPLLGFLVLHRDAHLSRDAVAFALWPDETEEGARAKLRHHLNYLKQALPATGDAWFVAEAETLRWNFRDTWLDAAAFESALDANVDLEGALELYRGDLLESSYDEWLVPMRNALRARYFNALDRLLLAARRRRDLRAAVTFAERILRDDPWREDTVRTLMTLRYENGDQSGALHVFEAFRRGLEAELASSPMQETLSLRDALMRSLPLGDEADVAEGGFGLIPSDDETRGVPLVGRDRELDLLRDAWQRAARGRGGFVLVGGDAGIGKTRLAAELALLAVAEGANAFRGTTSPAESVPFQAICEALRGAARALAALDIAPLWLAALSPILPELAAHREDLPVPAPLGAAEEQRRLFDALGRAVGGLARRRPMLLIVEDVHWAGPATIGALEYLARRAAAQKYLIVATYRSADAAAGSAVARLRRTLSAENLVTHVVLDALDDSAVDRLVAAVLPDAGERLRRRVVTASEGNPLFALELLRERLEVPKAIPGPRATLRETIAGRVARLSSETRVYAQIASVIGGAFDVEVLREVAGGDDDDAARAVADLLDRRFVRDIGASRFAYAFTHQLVQAAIYEGIETAPLARWHQRAAVAIERLDDGSGRADLAIAQHYEAAGDREAAALNYAAAARRSFAIGALDEAADVSARAVRLADSDRTRYAALDVQARIAMRRAQWRDCYTLLVELTALAGKLNESDAECDVVCRRMRLAAILADRKAEAALQAALLVMAQRAGSGRWIVEALLGGARIAYKAGSWSDVRAAWVAAQPHRDAAEPLTMITFAVVAATAAAYSGAPDEARDLVEAARTAADATGDRLTKLHFAIVAVNIAQILGDLDEFDALNQRALDDARALGDRDNEINALQGLGIVAWASWDIATARERLMAAIEGAEAIGHTELAARIRSDLAALEIDVGRLDEATDLLNRARSIFEPLGTSDALAECDQHAARVALLRGDAARAAAACRAALDVTSGSYHRLGWSLLSSAAELAGGHFDAATLAAQEALADAARLGIPHRIAEARWSLVLAHHGAGKAREALPIVEAYIGAGDSARRSFAPTLPPRFLFAAGLVFGALGEAPRANAAFTRAGQAFASLRDAIADEPSRAAFAALPYHRAIAERRSPVLVQRGQERVEQLGEDQRLIEHDEVP